MQARDQLTQETERYKAAHQELLATGIAGQTLKREESKATRALTNIMDIQAKCTRVLADLRAESGPPMRFEATVGSVPDESIEEREARMEQFTSSTRVNLQLLERLKAKNKGRKIKLAGEGLTIYDGKSVINFQGWIVI